jgi:hypothetical protein
MKAATGRANHLFPDDQKNRPHDSHLDLLRFQHAKVKVGSAVHLDITRFLMIIFSEKYLVIPNENIIFAPNLGI